MGVLLSMGELRANHYGTIGMLHVKLQRCRAQVGTRPGRDLQALGAYFCRTFFRLGDDDLLSTSMSCIGDGWLFMAR